MTGTFPAVMGTRWRNVPGTAKAVVLVNFSETPRRVTFELKDDTPATAVKLPGQPEIPFTQVGRKISAEISPRAFFALRSESSH